MRYIFGLLLIAVATHPAARLHAEGLISRSPEVGEYIVYDILVDPIQEDEDRLTSEVEGTLRVACVGVEQAEGSISRWIEGDLRLGDNADGEFHMVFKLLVPDGGVSDQDAYLPISRGWVQVADGVEAAPVSPDRISLTHPAFLFMRTLLVSPERPEESAQERQVVINGEEQTFTTARVGTLETLVEAVEDQLRITLTGEGTWWTDHELAFLPAADVVWFMQLDESADSSAVGATKGMGLQLEATATGDDAVTQLPDAN